MRDQVHSDFQQLVEGLVFDKTADELINDFVLNYKRDGSISDLYTFERNIADLQAAVMMLSQHRKAFMELQLQGFSTAVQISREKWMMEALKAVEAQFDILKPVKETQVSGYENASKAFAEEGNLGNARLYEGMTETVKAELSAVKSRDGLILKKWMAAEKSSSFLITAMQTKGHILNFRERLEQIVSYLYDDVDSVLSALTAVEFYTAQHLGRGKSYTTGFSNSTGRAFDGIVSAVYSVLRWSRTELISEREEIIFISLREKLGIHDYARLLNGETISLTIEPVSGITLRSVGLSLILNFNYVNTMANRDYYASAEVTPPILTLSEEDENKFGLNYKHTVKTSNLLDLMGLEYDEFLVSLTDTVVDEKFNHASFESFRISQVFQHDPRLTHHKCVGEGISRRPPQGEWKIRLGSFHGLSGQVLNENATVTDGPNGPVLVPPTTVADVFFIMIVAAQRKPTKFIL